MSATLDSATEWPCVAERYAEGRRYGAATVRAYGLRRASRYIVAEANAGDLCQASAAGALDVLLDVASVCAAGPWLDGVSECDGCDRGVKHVHEVTA